MASLHGKMAKGAVWMIAFKLLDRVIGLCSIVVLARMLVPADFGLVAMAMAVIGALEVLGAFSFDVALIQRQDTDRGHYDTAWTFNVCIGLASTVIVFALAGPVASFYDEPRLSHVMHVLAAVPIIGALENIGIVAFRKELRFDLDFSFLLSKRLVMTSVTVVLAFVWGDYRALLAGMVAGRLFGTVLSYFLSRYRPRLSMVRRHDLFSFSIWLFFNNIMSFISNRLSTFLLGKTVGIGPLGIYNLATEIAYLPTTELVTPINRAVFPAFARMGNDIAALRNSYLRVTGVIALFAIPAALGLVVTASNLIPIIFGERWVEAVPLVQVLACYGMLQALQNNVSNVYYSLGLARFATIVSFLYNLALIPTLTVMSFRWGVMGAALAFLTVGSLLALINFGAMLRLLHFPIQSLFSILWRPAIAGVAMTLSVTEVREQLAPELPPIVVLMALVSSGLVMYLLVIALTWYAAHRPDGAERDAIELLRRSLTGLRRSR